MHNMEHGVDLPDPYYSSEDDSDPSHSDLNNENAIPEGKDLPDPFYSDFEETPHKTDPSSARPSPSPNVSEEFTPEHHDAAAQTVPNVEYYKIQSRSNAAIVTIQRLENALKRSVAACLSAEVEVPPPLPLKHYTYCLSPEEVHILTEAGATSGYNRLNKILQLEELGDMQVDHVISLRELDVSKAEKVQLWRSIAMWDPMLASDNLSKGSGKYSCILRESETETYYLHDSSRRVVSLDSCKDLKQRWEWVTHRKKALESSMGSCSCGVCVVGCDGNIGGLTKEQKLELDDWLLGFLYMKLLSLFVKFSGQNSRTMSDIAANGIGLPLLPPRYKNSNPVQQISALPGSIVSTTPSLNDVNVCLWQAAIRHDYALTDSFTQKAQQILQYPIMSVMTAPILGKDEQSPRSVSWKDDLLRQASQYVLPLKNPTIVEYFNGKKPEFIQILAGLLFRA